MLIKEINDRSLQDVIDNKKKGIFNNHIKQLYQTIDQMIEIDTGRGIKYYFATINFMHAKQENTSEQDHLNDSVNWLAGSLDDMPMIDFFHFVLEPYEKGTLKGQYHMHAIIGVRLLCGFSENITKMLRTRLGLVIFDVDIKRLNSFLSIKKAYRYLYKNQKFWFTNHQIRIMGYKPMTFIDAEEIENIKLGQREIFPEKINNVKAQNTPTGYNSLITMMHKIFKDCSPSEKFSKMLNLTFRKRSIVFVENDTSYLQGLKTKTETPDWGGVVHLIVTYCYLTNTFQCGGNLYRKAEKALCTYECIGSLDYFRDNLRKVVNDMQELFEHELPAFENTDFYTKNWDRAVRELEHAPNTLPSKNIQLELIEFRDGIYSIQDNLLFKNKTQFLEAGKLCFKYFDTTFETARKAPQVWLSDLLDRLGNQEQVQKIATWLGKIFFWTQVQNTSKRNSLYVHGASNAGKTQLIVAVLERMLGKANVGVITGNNPFGFEKIQNAAVAIWDEFQNMTDDNRELILKLTGGQDVMIQRKYKTNIQINASLPVAFISNNAMPYDKAFQNRVNEFKFEANNEELEFLELEGHAKEVELAKILIYCSRLAWREVNQKTKAKPNEIQKLKILNRLLGPEVKKAILDNKNQFLTE